MPETTFFLRFHHADSSEIEEFEHISEADAREHMGLFGPRDADLYTHIDLISYNWHTREEHLLDTHTL